MTWNNLTVNRTYIKNAKYRRFACSQTANVDEICKTNAHWLFFPPSLGDLSLLSIMGCHDLISSSPKLVSWTVPCQDWRSSLVQPSPVFGHFTLHTDQRLCSWLTGFKLRSFVAFTEALKLHLICTATFSTTVYRTPDSILLHTEQTTCRDIK